MGTRNLTAVMVDGEYKLAQYGQWDGYPTGNGIVALAFAQAQLTTPGGQQAFKEKLKQVRFVSDDEHKALWKSLGVTDVWVDQKQSRAFDEKWPHFSRDHGAGILRQVMDATGPVLTQDHMAFANDSLFCEWAYIIDLDKNTFEVFRGFNNDPLTVDDRFGAIASREPEPGEGPNPSGRSYHPIKLAKAWLLNDLPSEEAFLRFFEELADEEEKRENAEP